MDTTNDKDPDMKKFLHSGKNNKDPDMKEFLHSGKMDSPICLLLVEDSTQHQQLIKNALLSGPLDIGKRALRHYSAELFSAKNEWA